MNSYIYNFSPDSEELFIKRYTPFLDSLDLDETEQINSNSPK